ncbi:MAG: hypothetical protein ACRERR_01830 [Moraxellaceae bacterium]
MATLIWRAPMSYYAPGDEAAFFNWLQSIPGVLSVKGIGRELHIQTRSTRLNRDSILEFVALYRRYLGNLNELVLFSTPANKAWLEPMLGLPADKKQRLRK